MALFTYDCESDSGFLPEREAEGVAHPHRLQAWATLACAWAWPPDLSRWHAAPPVRGPTAHPNLPLVPLDTY
jgi:hypothetical protein